MKQARLAEHVPGYKMGRIARLTGLSPELLRAWERRHGLLVPLRTEGGHRMYTDDDLLVLREVQRRLGDGQSIGEVARVGRDALLGSARGRTAPVVGHRSESAQLEEARHMLVRAAIELDEDLAEEALQAALAQASPRDVVDRTLGPALREIGERWTAGEVGVAGEHLVSTAVRGRLMKLLSWEVQRAAPGAPLILCACLPGELHENGGLIKALRLAWAGRRVVWLGANLPFAELARAVQMRRPQGVQLTVAIRSIFDAHRDELLAFARSLDPHVALRVGGGGVPQDDAELRQLGLLAGALDQGLLRTRG